MQQFVIPTKVGIHSHRQILDSCFRRNDSKDVTLFIAVTIKSKCKMTNQNLKMKKINFAS